MRHETCWLNLDKAMHLCNFEHESYPVIWQPGGETGVGGFQLHGTNRYYPPGTPGGFPENRLFNAPKGQKVSKLD